MTRLRRVTVAATALMLVAAWVAVAEAQRGSRSGNWRGSFLGLIRNEAVQKELDLDDELAAKMETMSEELGAEMRKEFAPLREIEDREERRAKMTELGEKFDGKAHEQLRELLPREKLIRLYQIRLQVRGAVYGLNHKYVAARLELTDEQKKKAAEIEACRDKKRSELYGELRSLGDDQRREKWREAFPKFRKIRSDADAEAMGLLTAKQKEAYADLQGEKFEMPSRGGRR